MKGALVSLEESRARHARGDRESSSKDELRWLEGDFWSFKRELFYQLLALRQEVFILEQRCFYLDADGVDLAPETEHLCALDLGTPQATPVAYLRIYNGDEHSEGIPTLTPFKIGRVLVALPWRGRGLGIELMQRAIASCARRRPGASLLLSAQAYLERFYQTLGFERCGDPFDEAGIPHIPMRRMPSASLSGEVSR